MNFFKNTSIGIDIADHTIEVVELQKKGKGIVLRSKNRVQLAPGIVERGKIKDKDRLKEALQKALQDAQPSISGRRIIFGLSDAITYIHHFELPKAADTNTHGAKNGLPQRIEEIARKNIPLPEDDLLFSYKTHTEKEGIVGGLIIGASRQTVSEWSGFFRGMGIKVEAFDIEALALFRGMLPGDPPHPFCIIDLGAVTTNIAVFDEKGLRYAHSIPVAGEALTKSICNALGKTSEEAELLKKDVGVANPGEQVCSVLIKTLEPIVKELEKSIAYFKRETGKEIKEIIVAGGSASLKGLTEYISANTSINTTVGKPAFIALADPLEYIEAVGLAIRGLYSKWEKRDPAIVIPKGQKNLKTKKQKREERERHKEKETLGSSDGDESETDRKLAFQKKLLIILLILGVIALAGSFWYRSYTRAEKEKAQQEKFQEELDRELEE